MDAVWPLLVVQRVRPADEREFGRRVGPRSRSRHARRCARHVDDRNAPAIRRSAPRGCAQRRQQRLRQANRRLEVELHVPLDVRPAGVRKRAAPSGPGIVHQQVERAVLALHDLSDSRGRVSGGYDRCELSRIDRGGAIERGENVVRELRLRGAQARGITAELEGGIEVHARHRAAGGSKGRITRPSLSCRCRSTDRPRGASWGRAR